MNSEDPIKDYAADAAVTTEAPAPVEAITSTGKKKTTRSFKTVVEETAPAPSSEPYIDERTRLEIAAGAAMLRANQERLKQAE